MSINDINDVKGSVNKDASMLHEQKYLVVNIAGEQIGFELSSIREIIRLPSVTVIPDSPVYLRGMIKLRDIVIPLIDLRKRLGFNSIEEENQKFMKMLYERENDHVEWVNELIKSIESKQEFKLTTDPHSCKFGKWYDKFKTKNVTIKNHLEKFDAPHKSIHKIGQKVQEMMKIGEFENAKLLYEKVKNEELKQLRVLFSELYRIIDKSNNEIAVVFDNGGKRKAITCDKINRIITVVPTQIQKANTLKYDDYVKGICQTDDLLFVIFDDSILT